MSLKPLLLASVLALSAAASARAGETACWYEGGVVVVPAEVAGVVGDYILDTAEPHTLLAESQAEGAGYADTAFPGDVRLAGERTAAVPLVVKAIDVRTGLFPTPIAGVIGADVLKAYVLDLRFSPCRLRLSAPGAAPAFGPATRVKLDTIAGLPAIEARVSDGTHALTGEFLLSTGADAPIRLSDAIAAAPGAEKPMEAYPNGVLRPQLSALAFAGRRFADLLAGLMTAPDPQIAGLLGAPLFHDLRLRIDMANGEALIAPNAKGPGSRRGPPKSKPSP